MERVITRRIALLIVADIVVSFTAYLLATILTFQWDELFVTTDYLFVIALFSVVNVAVFGIFHLYSGMWEFASYDTITQVGISVILGTLCGALLSWVMGVRPPIRVFVVAFLFLLFFVGGLRFIFRYIYFFGKSRRELAVKEKRPRTLLVGAGETGAMCINRMLNGDYAIQGIPIIAVDDDESKQGLRIHGVKVLGTRHDILRLVQEYEIEQIVVAILAAPPEDRRDIFALCAQTDCKLLTLPDVRDLRVSEIGDVALREVRISDLLGRDEIVLDTCLVSSYVANKTVLITGAGGSIGSELTRQLANIFPKKLVLLDIYENGVFELRGELLEKNPQLNICIEIGSVRDKKRLEEVFEKHRPEVVFHAAAHKHVPLMETCPREAVKNNVFGTLHTVDTALAFGVERFIFISTDKAVNPANVMGATKRLGEMIIQSYAAIHKKTIFTAVRFGNVLGSNGSVIPIFKRQIASGGPIRVTHPDIERYFMTIPEAARLVVQAGGMASGGEIFILNMGEPVKIIDLARNMIRLSGLTEGIDIDIEISGLRPGEKLYEELLMEGEKTVPTAHGDIMISLGDAVDAEKVMEGLDLLAQHIGDPDEEIRSLLAQLVPSFHIQEKRQW